jgi:hypothetical protein
VGVQVAPERGSHLLATAGERLLVPLAQVGEVTRDLAVECLLDHLCRAGADAGDALQPAMTTSLLEVVDAQVRDRGRGLPERLDLVGDRPLALEPEPDLPQCVRGIQRVSPE